MINDTLNEHNVLETTKKVSVDEQAFMLVNEKSIGVTNEAKDILKKIELMPEGQAVSIIKGQKEDLLSLEQKLLIIDCLINNPYSNNLNVPERLDDYNLIDREKPKNKLFEVLLK